MKKLVILFAVLFLAVFILLPGIGHGKYNVSKPLVADGWPLPPPPPGPVASSLLADGWPLPPPPPPSGSGSYLASSSETLVADGWPLPPPIPPSSNVVLNLV